MLSFVKLFKIICGLDQDFFTFYGGGKGGGGGSQQSTSYSTNLPEYAKPFYQELLKQSGQQIYETDADGKVTGVKKFVPYEGDRLAGFTPEQQQVQQEALGMTTPGGFQTAAGTLGTVGGQSGMASAAGLNQAFGYQPDQIASQQISGLPSVNAALLGRQSNIDAGILRAPSEISTDKFTDPRIAQQYMDPYTRNVLDVQKDEARRQAGIQQQQQAMASIGRGTFGGGREALMQSEADRNTQQLLAKIEAEGQTDAFKRAQEAFQADQARQLQAQQANVQFGLQAGIQNQQAALDAAKSNQAALLQAGQSDQAAQMQAQIQNMQANLDAAKANQAANLQAQQLGQQGQQFAAGLGKDVGLTGLQTGLETAKATGALSATEQMANLERLKAQAATAGEKQALEQEQLNLAYQQYQEEQDYQRRLLEYQSNILRGNAAALGSTQVQYAPAPSLASQIGGLGLAGLGLYNILGKG
jgi:hypothetical protein